MKQSSIIVISLVLTGLVFTACNKPQPTQREALLQRLQGLQQNGCMFGHQDDPFYGIGWEYEDGLTTTASVEIIKALVAKNKGL